MTDELWTVIWGSYHGYSEPVYGTRGEFDINVKPGYRRNPYLSYDVRKDSLIVFGGFATANFYYCSMMEYSFRRNQWRWLTGSKNNNIDSIYGEQGIEGPFNFPGGRSHGQFFTDFDSGYFYIYGGADRDGSIAELWRFNLISGYWAWLSGTWRRDVAPIYDSASAFPGGMASSAFAYDQQTKKFYLFGGWEAATFSKSNTQDTINDLWEYDLTSSRWQRLSGSNTRNSQGVYGPAGVSSRSYLPRSRCFSYMSLDTTNKALYLFGGINGYNYLNDFWRFNITSLEWTLLGGAATLIPGNYGQRGIIAATNYPPARADGACFFSSVSNKFYIFGGVTSMSPIRKFADTWSWVGASGYHSASLSKSTTVATRTNQAENNKTETFPLMGSIAISAAIAVLAAVVSFAIYSRRSQLVIVKSKISTTGASYSSSKRTSSLSINSHSGPVRLASDYSSVQGTSSIASNNTQTLFAEFEGLAVPAHLAVNQTDFRLEKEIAKGGGGTVYLAQATTQVLKRNPRFVAKVVYANEIGAKEHFYQEISIMYVLKDARNIAKLIGYCEDPLTMLVKYYAEGNLLEFRKNLKTRPKLRLLLIKDIACGLSELHSRDLAHCDIKPDNVLIDIIRGRPTAVLTDFGITQVLNDRLLQVKAFTIANLRGASVGYAGPEVFQRLRHKIQASAEVIKAGDLYSYSCVLYFTLKRRPPWK